MRSPGLNPGCPWMRTHRLFRTQRKRKLPLQNASRCIHSGPAFAKRRASVGRLFRSGWCSGQFNSICYSWSWWNGLGRGGVGRQMRSAASEGSPAATMQADTCMVAGVYCRCHSRLTVSMSRFGLRLASLYWGLPYALKCGVSPDENK